MRIMEKCLEGVALVIASVFATIRLAARILKRIWPEKFKA